MATRRDVGKTRSRRLAKLETILKLAYQMERKSRFGRIPRDGTRSVLFDALLELEPSFLERYIESNEELAKANRKKRVILFDRRRLSNTYRDKHPLVYVLMSREADQWASAPEGRGDSWRHAIAIYYTRSGDW